MEFSVSLRTWIACSNLRSPNPQHEATSLGVPLIFSPDSKLGKLTNHIKCLLLANMLPVSPVTTSDQAVHSFSPHKAFYFSLCLWVSSKRAHGHGWVPCYLEQALNEQCVFSFGWSLLMSREISRQGPNKAPRIYMFYKLTFFPNELFIYPYSLKNWDIIHIPQNLLF